MHTTTAFCHISSKVLAGCRWFRETISGRDAYHARYCAIVAPAFGPEIELASELQNHRVSAWSVHDLTTLLQMQSNPHEMRPLLEPGYAEDVLTDLVWDRLHGENKRVTLTCAYILKAGWVAQVAAAANATPAEAPRLTIDAAMLLADQAQMTAARHRARAKRLKRRLPTSRIVASHKPFGSMVKEVQLWLPEGRDSLLPREGARQAHLGNSRPGQMSDERRRDILAAGQLLRNINNAAALRDNALVTRLLSPSDDSTTVLGRCRVLVLEAVESLRSGGRPTALHAHRQHAIITRYDLSGEPRQALERDLGIRSSKFYYERRAALARLASRLKTNKGVMPVATQVLEDRFLVQLECAMSLHEAGRFDLSISLLRGLAQETTQNDRRARVLCTLVGVLCDTSDIETATELLESARQTASVQSVVDSDASILRARLDLAFMTLSCVTGMRREALDIGDRAARLLRSPALRSHESLKLLAEILDVEGVIRSNAGMVSEAKNNFEEASALLDQCAPASSAHAMILTNLAFAEAITPGQLRRGRETNVRALHLAGKYRMLQVIAAAHVNESQFQYWRGEHKAALVQIRIAQGLASAVCPPLEKARVASQHARLEALTGSAQRGLMRARETRLLVPGKSFDWVLSTIIEGEILGHLGHYRAALRAADAAAKRADEISNTRGRGMAALVQAQSYEALGEQGNALGCLELSIPALQQSSSLYPLAQALECSARVTKNKREERAAREILMSFRR